ncbi:MAG: VWA domain-containing protein [Polyangia bacterium]|jgi:hypothetical protein|nr:VWA domain-containing protein [Polyangia bacterium]
MKTGSCNLAIFVGRLGGIVSLSFCMLLGACGPTTTDPGNDNNYNGHADAALPRLDSALPQGDAFVFADSGGGPDAEVCGAQTEEIELINLGDPPDLLIVLDRSGSMSLAPGLFPFGNSKWNIMKTALGTVLASRQNNIRFGLTVFPTDNDCAVDPGARVGIALTNAQAISDYLNLTSPNGNTPAHFGLQEALAYYLTIPENTAGRYVLFATDGAPNCGGDPPNVDIATEAETVQAVTDLANAGIHTFVLGFDVGFLGLEAQVLNDAAQAGLEPKPGGPPHYYAADDAATLEAALTTIAGGIIIPSCSFELTSLPPVPDDVAVYFDGVAVPRNPSHSDGWDYYPDAGTITFFGSYCTALETGQVQDVSFIFGCPGPVVN